MTPRIYTIKYVMTYAAMLMQCFKQQFMQATNQISQKNLYKKTGTENKDPIVSVWSYFDLLWHFVLDFHANILFFC